MDFSVSEMCGWRGTLKSDIAGEFWIDREALTQRMSQLSKEQSAMYRWGIIDEFREGLNQILGQDQAVGDMRDDQQAMITKVVHIRQNGKVPS